MAHAPSIHTPSLEGGGRSSLVRGGVTSAPRKRALALRRIIVAVLTCAIALFLVAVGLQYFSTSSPARAIYWVHDALWLPAHSWLWTSFFPYGLVWLLPLTVLGSLALAEFMGLMQPIRRAQVWVITTALDRGLAGLLVAANRATVALAGSEGTLLAAVVRDRRTAARDAVIGADRGATGGLQRYQNLMLQLHPEDRAEGIAALEAVALTRTLKQPEDRALHDALLRYWPDLNQQWQDAATPSPESDPLEIILRQSSQMAMLTAEQAAVATLGYGCAHKPGAAGLLVWHEAWAHVSYGGLDAARTLRAAEALIQFEHWAARAESQQERPQPVAGLDPVLRNALPGLEPARSRGEWAARQAGEPAARKVPT